MVEALIVLQRQFTVVVADERSNFFGLLRDEFDDRLRILREELDEWAVMALVASGEATLRGDVDGRLRRKDKDNLRRRFRDLWKRCEGAVPLPELLDAWKDEIGEKQRIGNFKQLLQRRHWLAHGRYWSDRSGVAPDPFQAALIIDELFQALGRSKFGFLVENDR